MPHPHPSATSGRAALWLLVAVALAALAYLLLGDPLGLLGGAGGRGSGDGEGDDLRAGTTETAPEAPEAGAGPSLAALYGDGDMGGMRMRLLEAETKRPRARQVVRLRSRSGGTVEVSTASDGVATFGRVVPGRGYQVSIEGAGFRPVSLVNLVVQRAETTDLGDILLGTSVVLRGRVVDPAGRPVPRATVSAYLPPRGTPGQGLVSFLVEQALQMPVPREEVVSDGEGLFAFSALVPGTYSVVARHPGFGTRQHNDVVVKPEGLASTLVVRLGEGARMSGRVTDAEGRAIAGASIMALRDQGNRFSLSGTLERDEAVTDAKGQYVLDTLVHGSSYRFGVLAVGFSSAWDQGATEVQHSLERDFTLVRGGFLEGTVRDEASGQPVVGASVTVVVGRFSMAAMQPRRGPGGSGGGAPAGGGDPTTPAMAKTDALGHFKLGPVLPGPVMSAVIKAPGYTAFSASMFTGNAWPDVALESTPAVDVSLKRGGRVSGRVLSPAGEPIPGATVTAAANNDMGAIWVGSPTTTSDAQGGYTVDGVPPGDYHLTAVAPGFTHGDAGSDATKVSVAADTGGSTLDLVLTASASIVGRVKDARGAPIAGARVRTRPDFQRVMRGGGGGGFGGRAGGGGAGARLVTALETRADLTDAEGRFLLSDVPTATEWIVEAEAEEYVSAQSERLKLGPGEVKELELVLSGGATLLGRVVGEGGAWLKGARVRVGTLNEDDAKRPFLSAWQIDRQLEANTWTTDEQGAFTIPNIRPGRILVRVEHPGYVTSYKRNLLLAPDQRLENHQVLLSRGEVVEGVVKGADGKPIAGALVAVTSRAAPRGEDESPPPAGSEEGVEPAMNATTDADGRFRVENIPPGEWNVAVGFAQGHVAWFGAGDENAIKRAVRVPARDLEFRLKAQEAGTSPFGVGPPRPPGPPTPRPPPAPVNPGTR